MLEKCSIFLFFDRADIHTYIHTYIQTYTHTQETTTVTLSAHARLSQIGKSFLIEAIKLLVHRIWGSDELTVVVAAPTGLAAFNVGGLTIHRLFQRPIEHEGQVAGYWLLSKSSQKVMKTKLCHVKLIIIDEISMVSSLNLAYIHLRLDELFGRLVMSGLALEICYLWATFFNCNLSMAVRCLKISPKKHSYIN